MRWILARRPQPVLWKGLVAGAAGGIGATVAMTAFQSLWTYVDDRLRNRGVDGRNGDSWKEDLDREPMSSEVEEESDETVEAAERLSEGFFGYELDARQKKLAGSAVHYGFGTAVGAVYAAAAEYSPKITRGDGVPFGAALMAVSDEVAVPALGLSQPHQEKPLSTHLYALCSHAVYGFVLETLRRSVRRAL